MCVEFTQYFCGETFTLKSRCRKKIDLIPEDRSVTQSDTPTISQTVSSGFHVLANSGHIWLAVII